MQSFVPLFSINFVEFRTSTEKFKISVIIIHVLLYVFCFDVFFINDIDKQTVYRQSKA